MRVFVTGASGWIGSAVVPELIAHGHQVVGLARSDEKAAAVAAAGAEVLRGDLDTLDVLAEGARTTDAVVHLAFVHDFGNFAESLRKDRAAIDTIGAALEGTGRPFAIASGTLGLTPGQVATEQTNPDPATAHPRQQSAAAALALAGRGVKPIIVRLAPTVHGAGDHGFVAELVRVARERKVAGYVGDGANRWTAVHRDDAAALIRLAIEKAANEEAMAGRVVHAVAEEAVTAREIAEAIGRGLGIETAPAAPEELGWIGPMFAADSPASNTITRETYGWNPTGPTLIEDLDAGHYFN
ncbi:SDR family oxidoreductase [Actinoplanes bogorensis]|uniref:SDR family oxidoreductase n=1 Tax=Paractinoplanes bogorensis TaxID=1610840 RepID=A0ABS5Z111_9ACTN|nr:SDR family oxidoreductase [Actinoplanes bogorensis]MBU2669384.1 SDR family oxidoreductase [Actinoplanes bogorensis]